MFADEADQDALEKRFLVFGAIYVPCSKAIEIVKSIERIRNENGFEASDPLKFSPGKIPKHVSREAHAKMKSELMGIAAEYGVKAACYVVLHDVAKNNSKESKLKWAVNTLCMNFDKFLRQSNFPSGLVFFDRTTDYKQDSYFKEIMAYGLPKHDDSRIPLKRVIGIHPSREGLCHLHSLCDVVVGSLRFVFNEPEKDEVGEKLFSQLSKLLWGKKSDDGKTWYVLEAGLLFRPKEISLANYAADRAETVSRLEKFHSQSN